MSDQNQHICPPKGSLKLLRYFLKKDYLEEIEGDMEEVFLDNLQFYSEKKAKRIYQWESLRLLRPILVKDLEEKYHFTQIGMIKNYIKVAFRIIKKEKAFAFINIFGLALAITCSLFIYLWVQDEMKFNDFLSTDDRVCYVFGTDTQSNGDIDTYDSSPYPLKQVLEEKYPEVEKSLVMSYGNWMAFKKDENLIEMEGIFSSLEVFDMFEMKFHQGDYQSMLDKPESIAISVNLANTIFGDTWQNSNVIGQFLTTEDNKKFELAGIFNDMPERSTLKFDYVIPHDYRLRDNKWLKHWGNSSSRLYLKIAENVTLEDARASVKNAVIDHADVDWVPTRKLYVQPYMDQYLYNRFEEGEVSGGRIDYIRLLSIGAILILVLASINFMNLSTARSAKRAKETGVRKVLGAFQSSLRMQHLVESVLITIIALLVAMLLVILLLSVFNDVIGKNITLEFVTVQFIFSLLVFMLLLGVFSGVYPAFYLSSMNTVVSLKGGHKHNKLDLLFRKGLVVFQFMITIVMITGAITVYRQVGYIQTKNIGLERSNLIRNWAHNMAPGKEYQTFKNELLKRPGIESVTTTNQNLISIGNSTSDPTWNGKPDDADLEFYILSANPDLIPTTQIELIAGRNFSWDRTIDTANFIINVAAQKLMELENPIGEDLEFWDRKGKIIGVIEDFHNASLHSPIEPLILRYELEDNWVILTRTKEGQTQEAIASIEEVYKIYNPDRNFYYEFMDDMYNEQYQSELMIKDLSLYFTVLAIVISCLGLFALVAYTAEQRTKEIGIRKVLGASIANILQLLSREFLWLLAISLVVAIPLAHYVMSGWLEGFAYRIELSWWLFAMAGMVTVVISYLIIGSHAMRSALANPVDSLRDE